MIVTIVGLGLIGGSLAITLKENGFAKTVIGVDQNKDHIDKAYRRRLIDEDFNLAEAIAKSDLIILAIPVSGIVKILPGILDLVENQIVMDVGSTKANILETVAVHPNRKQFIGTHPMAGTEFSGPEAAIPNLFDHKVTVICNPKESSAEALTMAEQVYQSIPMDIVYLDAKEHDVHTAYISHISHISSFALALTVLAKEKDTSRIFELAGGGFSSTVRLAKSSPDMWTPVFEQNRDNVLDVLDEHINTLAHFRTLLIKKDFNKIFQLIEHSNQIRKILEK